MTNPESSSEVGGVDKLCIVPALTLRVPVGLSFSLNNLCSHFCSFSSTNSCLCNYCNFLFKINSFQVKSKCVLNRNSFRSLFNLSFSECFRLSNLLFKLPASKSLNNGNAKDLARRKFGSQHACPLLDGAGFDSQVESSASCSSFCDNAEHLFECFSISDSRRGEFFPVYGAYSCWYTTCTSCGAACAFASPRESMILVGFLSLFEVHYTGNEYYAGFPFHDERVHISRATARVLLVLRDAFGEVAGMNLPHRDPPCDIPHVAIFPYAVDNGVNYRTVCERRFAKNDIVSSSNDCDHEFVLFSTHGYRIRLTSSMMRVLLLLMPGHGYLYGTMGPLEEHLSEDTIIYVNQACGIKSIGGLLGVNMQCNDKFMSLHQNFYKGSPRGPCEMADNVDRESMNSVWVIPVQKQSSGADEENYDEAVLTEEEVIDELQALIDDDDPLFSIEDEVPRVATRGLGDLGRRVGRLLKGVTNCVTKLHAVWDWPLDTALKAIHGLGAFLDDNKEFVSEETWACKMCLEVQKDTQTMGEEQTKFMNGLQSAIKKLSEAMDGFTGMAKVNFSKIDDRIGKLESTPKAEAPKNCITYDEFRRTILQLQNDIAELKKSQRKEPEKASTSAAAAVDRPLLRYGEEAGEQMPIPRDLHERFHALPPAKQIAMKRNILRAEKQSRSDVVGDFPVESVSDSGGGNVHAVGPSDLVDVLRSEIHVSSFQWNVSDGSGKVLKDVRIPEDVWESGNKFQMFAQHFQYFSCKKISFKITLTSVGMQGGTLLVAWDSVSCATRQKIDSVLQLSNLQFGLLHASNSSELNFVVDSPQIQHLICHSGSEFSISNLGTLKICIANVLNTASETSQQVAVNVWVRFVEPLVNTFTLSSTLMEKQSGHMLFDRELQDIASIVHTGQWNTTSQPNLCSLTVHPTACHIANGLVSQTTLSVLSHLFSRWSGSLEYTLVFGASMFVKGKLLVCAIPVAFRENVPTIEQAMLYPNIVCDLSTGQTEFRFEVPYYSIGQKSLITRDSLYDVSSYNASLVTTRLHVLVLDPLVMNANASNSVEYFVICRPGPSFKLEHVCGVKAEFVDRVIKQGIGRSITGLSFVANGFDEWSHISSKLCEFTLSSESLSAFHLNVTPFLRMHPPCVTLLGWLAQLFSQWSGSLEYTLCVHSHDKTKSSYLRIWHDPNGSAQNEAECEFLSDVEPPSGCDVKIHHPGLEANASFIVPFTARTPKLMLCKARYSPEDGDWLHFYNGSIVIDFVGSGSVSCELYISGGPSYNMFERTVPPRCGKVSAAFTKLSYESNLKGIDKYPLSDGRLQGPVNKAVKKGVSFTPVEGTNKGKPAPEARSLPPAYESGDEALTDEGEPIVFSGGQWHLLRGEKQMGCIPCVSDLKAAAKEAEILSERGTCSKVADLVDLGYEAFYNSDSKLGSIMSALLPLLGKAEKFADNCETGLGMLESVKDKVLSLLTSIVKETIPGMMLSTVREGNYAWATVLTLVGSAAIIWFCKSKAKIGKKIAVLCMIVWSPFIASKVWELGSWIRGNFFPQREKKEERCRPHLLVGTSEGLGEMLGNFTEWLAGNWAVVAQSLLMVLGVVASLVVWGTIPDGKKLESFSAKFKEVGDKGRTFSNIFSGFTSIQKMCGEWSQKLVSWLLGLSGGALPKADSALQSILDFDLRKWVKDVRDLSLQENRFVDFGADERLIVVRNLYDKSEKVQKALIEGCKVDAQLGLIIRDCKDKCTELLNESYTYKGMKKPRIDPIHVSFLGKPGVGKSAIAEKVINDLLDHRGEPRIDRIYTRCCADQYWSNYHHEPVIFYDDLGAISSKLKLSDYAEIMGVKSNRPFSVPMAAVEDKGKHCTSKYVFSCTNKWYLDDTGDVTTKAAFYRRRNVMVEVERESAMNPEDPTEGLVFTVAGPRGNNPENPIFGTKTEWNENFLQNIDTSEWEFNRVPYSTFLKFLSVYCSAYMENQEKLLKGANRTHTVDYSSDEVFETNEAEAQSGEVTYTLRELIECFDNLNVKAGDLSKYMQESGFLVPKEWRKKKVLGFYELMRTCCGCSNKEVCSFDMFLARISNVAKRNLKGKPKFAPRFTSMSSDPEAIVLSFKDAVRLEVFEPSDVWAVLATYYKWSFVGGTCYYEMEKFKNFSKGREVVEADDDFEITQPVSIIGGQKYISWPTLSLLLPGVECLSVFDGAGFVRVICTEDGFKSEVDDVGIWNSFWAEGFTVETNFQYLLNDRDRAIARLLIKDIVDFGDGTHYSEDFKRVLLEARDIFVEEARFVAFILYCVEVRLAAYRIARKNAEKLKKRQLSCSFFQKFEDYEKGIIPGYSKNVKICLAVAGGITFAGALIGSIYGLISLFGKTKKIVEESGDPVEAVAEMAGGWASSGEQTHFHATQKRHPKVLFSPMLADKQVSGAFASSGEQTHFQVVGKKAPRVLANFWSAEPQKGFGLTYDEATPLHNDLVKLGKKKQKLRVSKAIKEIVQEEKSSSEILEGLTKWRKGYLDKKILDTETGLVPGASEHVVKASKQVVNDGILFENDDDFVVHDSVMATIEQLFSTHELELKKIVKDGTCIKGERQAMVGRYGIERDTNMTDMIKTHVTKMSCVLLKLHDGKAKYASVLRLKGTFVLCPAHYCDDFLDGDEVYFVCLHKVVKITLDYSKACLVSKFQDLLVWDLGTTIPASIDYMKHIPTAEDWKHYRKGSGALVITQYGHEVTLSFVHVLDSIEQVAPNSGVDSCSYSMGDGNHVIVTGLRYRVHCAPGFCGAAILRGDTKMTRKIVGMHVAGEKNSGIGYAESLVFEPILQAMKTIEGARHISKSEDVCKVDVCQKHSREISGKGNLGLIGIVPRGQQASLPTKTSICKSIIHAEIGAVKTEPSILSTWDHRLGTKRGEWDPIVEGALKYGIYTKPFPKSLIDLTTQHLIKHFLWMDNPLQKREVNSTEIGINGIDLTDYWNPMEMKTSAGWPYCTRKPSGAVGKSWLFRENGKYQSGRVRYEFDDSELIANFEHYHDEIKQGVVPRFCTIECPKDERRKLSKIYDTPATRTFTILAPEVNILFRMYFGDFAAMVMANRFSSFTQVGINPETLEWSELMNGLKAMGPNGFAGDYAKFDGIGPAEIYHAIVDVINVWYGDGDENARARHCLIHAIVHREGIAGDVLLSYSQGMPSGFAMTVIFNSFVNYYFMAIAWMSIVQKSELRHQWDLKSFDTYTKIIVYGDDNVVAVHSAFEKVYNLRSVARFLAEHNVTYTDDAKNPIDMSEPVVPIESVTFLKREFHQLGQSSGIWKCPLNKTSIEERIHWIRETEDPIDALQQNVESAFHEAAIWGEGYFSDFKDRVNGALRKALLPECNMSYLECHSDWWNNMTSFAVPGNDLLSLVELSKKNEISLGNKFKDLKLSDGQTLGVVLRDAVKVQTVLYK
ncbi:TPA_asm: polyprotein [Thymus vulgaris waikavirus]|uniref:Genome polyprotein n=1 Tax=Thymus vulgaris waikavirus TaxID=3027352 RepID=A0AA48P954_9SECO|nr:TPA_asm: polyprotein [Thymus vulgaris waikavirus]